MRGSQVNGVGIGMHATILGLLEHSTDVTAVDLIADISTNQWVAHTWVS